MHGSGGDGNPEGVAVGGVSREQTTSSDTRRQISGIGYRRRSGEQRTLWIDDEGLLFWYGDRGIPGGRMILCGGATVGVGGQGRRRNLPWREV